MRCSSFLDRSRRFRLTLQRHNLTIMILPVQRFVSCGLLAVAALAAFLACRGESSVATAPRALTSLVVTAPTTSLEQGQTVTPTVSGVDQGGGSFPVGTVRWSVSNSAVATVSSTGMVRAVGEGSGLILATVGTITGQLAITVTNAPAIVINEVESQQGEPGDWVELFNPTTSPVSLVGWRLTDDDTSRTFRFSPGTTIPAGGILVVEEAEFGFGLGQPDAVRLLSRYDVLVDSYAWTTHAPVTYGRCPDGTGAFVPNATATKGAANDCGALPPPSSFPAWPGAGEITTAGVGGRVFGGNMSGLAWEAPVGGAPAVLWAARNGPGAIFRLVEQGGLWVADPANGWSAGKALRYPDGTGDVDAEGIAFAGGGSAAGMYIAAERNNAASGMSRNSVLRYDVSAAGSVLVATHEWNLTANLPATGANLGLEAITWIPDTALVAQQFFDESRSTVYDPATYPGHGTGLFFVGLEANGTIYAFALNHTNNSFTRIATINSGFTGVMDLEYDLATRYLWAVCDDTCQGRHAVLEIESAAGATRGRYRAPRVFQRPSGMPNINNEGFAFVSDASCTAGRKTVFWADDNETDGHALRRGLMPCGPIPAARTAGALGARR